MDRLVLPPDEMLQSVLCITTNKYLVHVLVVLLHARFSVFGPIPFQLAAILFSVHPYIGSTTVLPDGRRVSSHGVPRLRARRGHYIYIQDSVDSLFSEKS